MIGYLPYIAYCLIAIIGTLCSELFDIRGWKKRSMACFVVILLVYLFMAIFRGPDVGIDNAQYTYYYGVAAEDGSEFVVENGIEVSYWGFLYLFSHVFCWPEITFYIFEYIIIGTLLFLSFYKEKHRCTALSLFLLLGYMIFSFSAIRQALAIPFLTYAFSIVWRKEGKLAIKDWILYFCLIIAGITFHEMCVIGLVMPLIFLIKLKKEAFPFFLLFTLFVPFFAGQALTWISQTTSTIYYPMSYHISATFIVMTILFIGFWVLSYAPIPQVRRHVEGLDDVPYKLRIYFYLFFAYLIFVAATPISTILPRFSYFFLAGIAMLVVYFSDLIKVQKWQIAFRILAIAGVSCYLLYYSGRSGIGVVPYEFVF